MLLRVIWVFFQKLRWLRLLHFMSMVLLQIMIIRKSLAKILTEFPRFFSRFNFSISLLLLVLVMPTCFLLPTFGRWIIVYPFTLTITLWIVILLIFVLVLALSIVAIFLSSPLVPKITFEVRLLRVWFVVLHMYQNLLKIINSMN